MKWWCKCTKHTVDTVLSKPKQHAVGEGLGFNLGYSKFKNGLTLKLKRTQYSKSQSRTKARRPIPVTPLQSTRKESYSVQNAQFSLVSIQSRFSSDYEFTNSSYQLQFKRYKLERQAGMVLVFSKST
jgi:hypothetical protein